MYNIEILRYQSIPMHDEVLSPFCIAGPSLACNEVVSLPVSLQPTALQLSTPHHPWLDLFPSPQMRDNLVVLEPLVDDYGLCEGLCNSMEGTAGILVWKDSWDPTGWEITKLFYVCLGLNRLQLLGSVSIYEPLASQTGREAIILGSTGDS
jgi:hypothetical protein